MPSFKPKTLKKIKVNKKNTITLDGKHKEMMNDFSKDSNDVIPSLKEEKKSLKKELIEKEETMNIEQKLEIIDRIQEINETIKELKNKQKEYFSFGFEYLYKDGDNNPLKYSSRDYLMRYNKNKKIENIKEFKIEDNTIEFIKIITIDQRNLGDLDLCGIYVIINSIIITNISKYYNNDIAFLVDKKFIRLFRDTIKQLIFNYIRNEKKIINENNTKNKKRYYNALGSFYRINNKQININTNNYENIVEANSIIKFMHSDNSIEHLNIGKKEGNFNKYFNLDLFEQHVIIAQFDFSNNRIFSAQCFINDNNLKIMKNFYNLDNYIITFIIGEEIRSSSYHWKCYTINKYMDEGKEIKYQFIYLDSLFGEPNPTITVKLKEIIRCQSFEYFLENIYTENQRIEEESPLKNNKNYSERINFFLMDSKYSTFFQQLS